MKNENALLPLDAATLKRVALIGPMADQPYEQLGTWIFDGDDSFSQTPLVASKDARPAHIELDHVKVLESTRSYDLSEAETAIEAARNADVTVVFLGEESILSGEAHSRADINLPGAQTELLAQLKATGTKLVTVILAGRPLTLPEIVANSDALLFAWHPGTMTGPALYDLIFGNAAPTARLPVSFPKMVGQIPIYYNHKNSGRPASDNQIMHIDEIQVGAKQTSFGMTAFHLDAGFRPLFPFGFGLSYSQFDYAGLQLDRTELSAGETLGVSVRVTNVGDRPGTETVQLYIRDMAASLTRPIRELKACKRVHLSPGQSETVHFQLTEEDLAFYRRDKTFGAEPGAFKVWVGPNVDAVLVADFVLKDVSN